MNKTLDLGELIDTALNDIILEKPNYIFQNLQIYIESYLNNLYVVASKDMRKIQRLLLELNEEIETFDFILDGRKISFELELKKEVLIIGELDKNDPYIKNLKEAQEKLVEFEKYLDKYEIIDMMKEKCQETFGVIEMIYWNYNDKHEYRVVINIPEEKWYNLRDILDQKKKSLRKESL